eukprot:CAMPEP_0117683594 /NCGR_PEP_ID=MMETSP0804-20121206/20509_1 /TAXON_ID=1074897 /ORGANISM="Tetraselmis astigmatica, Strain CCMP880" /LENGTH=72 /DNA_ID=CAMNT_0005494249 /DNA_START=372 /DNA_END=590 /DNA_ORIENTATION=+
MSERLLSSCAMACQAWDARGQQRHGTDPRNPFMPSTPSSTTMAPSELTLKAVGEAAKVPIMYCHHTGWQTAH